MFRRKTFSIVWVMLILFSTVMPAHADRVPATLIKNNVLNSHTIDSEKRKTFLMETDKSAMAVLTYWFEEWDEDKTRGGKGKYNDKWFPHGPRGVEGSKKVDEEIRQKFLPTYQAVLDGKIKWDIETNPFENLAYILLFDQFTRNMFRGTEQAYENDHLSRAAVKHNISQGLYNYYFTGYQKLFVVYPLMHHENIESQQMSLQFLKDINEHPEHPYEFLNALQKGVEHFQMIFMFDRFPHRNVRQNRTDTKLEAIYLSKKSEKGFVDGSKW